MMVIRFVAALMAKILSPSVVLIRAAIAWIHTGRRRAATVPAGRGALRLHLHRLCPPATPRVVKRTSRSSHRSSGHAKRPCRTGGGGVIFAGSTGGAGQEAGGALASVL